LSWLASKLWNQTGMQFLNKELLQNCKGAEEEVTAARLRIRAGE